MKIFCIGFNKTGTTSLHLAFEHLGFKSVHFRCEKGMLKDIFIKNHKNKKKLLTGVDDFDAYSDWVFSSTMNFYKKLDKQYPKSKFILHTRNMNDWLDSREAHVKRNQNNPDYRGDFLEIDREKWKNEWKKHHEDVFKYFKNKPEDLLVIDITKGEGWKKLCSFLNVPIPQKPFPKSNKTNLYKRVSEKFPSIKNILNQIRKLYKRLKRIWGFV